MAAVPPGNDEANVGESLLALLIVIVFAVIGGFMVKMIRGLHFSKNWPLIGGKKIRGFCYNISCCKKIVIPPLIGEVVMGAIARNFLPSDVMDKYDDRWASYIRMMCLGVILLRGGMELEFEGQGIGVVLITVIPPLTEGIVAGLLAHWWLDMSLSLGFSLGAVLGAVSPAVLVPCLMNLQVRRYGVKKGIPLTLLAASSFNDVFNITLFALTSTLAYQQAGTSDKSIGGILLKIFLEIIGGIAVGIILGLLMKLITHTSHVVKAIVSMFITAFFVVVSEVLSLPEAKYIGIITYGYICFRLWGVAGKPEHLLARIWVFFTPFLFGTIGAALIFDKISSDVILPGLGIVIFGVLFRGLAAMGSMALTKKYNVQELGFMAIAWVPKATVQAAIGGVILDYANSKDAEELKGPGQDILTTAVLSVILCAPLGAIFTVSLGQKWLSKDDAPQKKVQQYSKWDIVFIYVQDYNQRRLLQRELDVKAVKDVPFFLSEEEKNRRMNDKQCYLYQLKIFKDKTVNVDEMELHRQQIQQDLEKLGSELEFASAFSSLANSRNNSVIMKQKNDKIKKLNEQKNIEDIPDIEIQNKKSQENQVTQRKSTDNDNKASEKDRDSNIDNKEARDEIIFQDKSMKYHDDVIRDIEEIQVLESSQPTQNNVVELPTGEYVPKFMVKLD